MGDMADMYDGDWEDAYWNWDQEYYEEDEILAAGWWNLDVSDVFEDLTDQDHD